MTHTDLDVLALSGHSVVKVNRTPEAPHDLRMRSHDEMVPAAETKVRLKSCRKTEIIGNTLYRCDVKGAHTTHHEGGLVLKGSGSDTDVEYTVTWHLVPRKKVRNAPK